MTMEYLGKVAEFGFNHWSTHIPVPEQIAVELMQNHNRRVLVWIKNEGPLHMALMKGKDYWYLILNKELVKKLNLDENTQVSIRLEKDLSEYGHEVPEEFQVLMDQDEEGMEYFSSLTKGKQRSLIYLVTKVKNPESRMRKSLAILHHLKSAKGKLDFRQLNEWIKHYNNL
ncbi:bacteriocin resistance YdeI/OmpD-like protein [Algoriphagus boseongensis]|uniref:Bacteriocin resistance YdeI/OmpD-like protein n=2 Tax=Algoriphagus boseongensis TaxID=1442587 RepID=A0A4R6T9P8_9BACT|nr:bacteriocin resistance YdeI/OmpD-like protein [Algoriphagus boseongensis]